MRARRLLHVRPRGAREGPDRDQHEAGHHPLSSPRSSIETFPGALRSLGRIADAANPAPRHEGRAPKRVGGAAVRSEQTSERRGVTGVVMAELKNPREFHQTRRWGQVDPCRTRSQERQSMIEDRTATNSAPSAAMTTTSHATSRVPTATSLRPRGLPRAQGTNPHIGASAAPKADLCTGLACVPARPSSLQAL